MLYNEISPEGKNQGLATEQQSSTEMIQQLQEQLDRERENNKSAIDALTKDNLSSFSFNYRLIIEALQRQISVLQKQVEQLTSSYAILYSVCIDLPIVQCPMEEFHPPLFLMPLLTKEHVRTTKTGSTIIFPFCYCSSHFHETV